MLKRLTALYVLALIVVVIGADTGHLAPLVVWVHHIPFGDKTCHFVLVGFLSFLLSASFSMDLRRRRKRTVVLSTIVILAVLTSLEELSQSLLTYRSFSGLDMLANIAGICFFGLLAMMLPSKATALETSQA